MIDPFEFESQSWCLCVPTVKTESIGTKSAEEVPATGDGLKGNVGKDRWNEFSGLVALDVLVGFTGDYAADGGCGVGDGGGGGGAKAVDSGYGENDGEGEKES